MSLILYRPTGVPRNHSKQETDFLDCDSAFVYEKVGLEVVLFQPLPIANNYSGPSQPKQVLAYFWGSSSCISGRDAKYEAIQALVPKDLWKNVSRVKASLFKTAKPLRRGVGSNQKTTCSVIFIFFCAFKEAYNGNKPGIRTPA